MDNVEFYIYEGELWCKDSNGHNELVDMSNDKLIDYMLTRIRERHPEAYKALQERYKDSAPNKIYYRYKMVVRFIRCNFGQLDSTAFDIENDVFRFERVDCPIRTECKYDGVICSPVIKTSLSQSEMRVGMLWYDGLTKEEIAGMLFLSPETVNSHIRNIYRKLDIHEKFEFVKYIKDNGYDKKRNAI